MQAGYQMDNGGNYLRVRGEYAIRGGHVSVDQELPPRARRILDEKDETHLRVGTTSACAENTLRKSVNSPHRRNYLRVRGEYGNVSWGKAQSLELPPRARRIPKFGIGLIGTVGTTSACAENTYAELGRRSRWWNYLRVRGEYLNELGLL